MKKRLISVLFFLIILILISFFSVSATFDQRKDHWLSKYSASDTRKSTHPHFGRTEILSWAEQGINLNNCRSNLESIYDSANAECKDVQADGTYMLCKDEVNNIEFNQEKNEYADLRCLEGNIQSSMTDRWNWPGSMAEVTLTRLLYQYSHVLSDAKKNELRVDINNQFKYMYYFKGGPDSDSEVEIQSESIGYLGALENKDVSMQYSVSGHDYGFTYNGRTYATGQTYNAFELRRDWLYKWFDNVVNSAKTENDGGYMLAPLGGLLLLHDFSERTNDPAGTVMKRKAKMMLDLILLDMLGQHSAGLQGGILGRYYKRNVVDGGFTFPFWHILGEGSDDGQYSDILVSSYRPSGLIESILVVAAKSDDYGHLVLEAGGSSGSKNSMIFVTKNYNLGSSKVQKLWILSVLTDYRVRGNPFSIWINSIHGDADHKNGCGVQECYFKYGNNGILISHDDNILMRSADITESISKNHRND